MLEMAELDGQGVTVLHQETDGKGGGIEEEGATEEGMEVEGGRCREEGGMGGWVDGMGLGMGGGMGGGRGAGLALL